MTGSPPPPPPPPSPPPPIEETIVESTDLHHERHSTKKRKLSFDNEILTPLNLQNVIDKQKISTKIVDKFWQPLDTTNSQSMNSILNIALLKTLEGEKNGQGQGQGRASRILTNSWLNPANPESFKARLDHTKLPPPNSMYNEKIRIKANEIKDVLSFDSISRKKTVLETYLLAELKQLQELENHYNQSLLAYHLDLEYLEKFKRTVKKHQVKLDKDIDDKNEKLNLIAHDKKPDDIYLKPNCTYKFDPDQDEDTKGILELLNNLLNISMSDLKKLNDKLENLSNMLD